MHQFTIDYITREANTGDIPSDCILSFDNKSENTDDGYVSRRSSRQTPSPSDSGMESDHSPKKCEGRKNEDDNAISNVSLMFVCVFFLNNAPNFPLYALILMLKYIMFKQLMKPLFLQHLVVKNFPKVL